MATGAKFQPLNLGRFFTAAPRDLGPQNAARALSEESSRDGLIRTLSGRQTLRGIPFELGGIGPSRKVWIVLSRRERPWSARRVEIPIKGEAVYVCLAQFCEWDANEQPAPGSDIMEQPGEVLAEAVLVYEDGTRHATPVRRRFEVNSLTYPWGHLCFNAVPHRQFEPRKLTEPLPNALAWGHLQLGVWDANYPANYNLTWRGTLWLCALENPYPDRKVASLTLEARSEAWLAVCGVTLSNLREHPFRYERLKLYRFTPPKGEQGPWEVSVDLGVVARSYELRPYVYAEVAAHPEATVSLHNSSGGAARVEVLEREKVWLHGRVTDSVSGKPTPARISFKSENGRYIPPYGHRTEINGGWFQDYGADLRRGSESFAYVDGTFQIELPAGGVFVEISKGFEYEPVRKRIEITASQRELNLEIGRFADSRTQGWITADTHVHFLSPSTAILEAQAEGLNLINLLAAEWGDLFTNVADLPHGPLTSKDGEAMVWVGTENRQHLLGHLGLLGGEGEPVFPMGGGGPGETYIGMPVWTSLAEWAETCREREGLAVAVHFPYPTGELAADIVLGKFDAVELNPAIRADQFNTMYTLEWYRYLNCGYRLPAVGGTDKMNAWVPVGASRTYAHVGGNEFSFRNWAAAVRSGNTFVSSGPLLYFQADGRWPGQEIALPSGGGTIEVLTEVKSVIPIHRLEIVLNGRVVASRQESPGAREMELREKVRVTGPGWLAARCRSEHRYQTAQIAAHTSPVYVTAPGQELFSAPVAAYLLTLIDGAETWVKDWAIRPGAERFARTLKVFSDARERLHRRMHRHGIAI